MARPDYMKNCTVECERPVECTTCGQRKKPVGRSAPLPAYLCGSDCSGYQQDPAPGHLWPGELADMDREEEADE